MKRVRVGFRGIIPIFPNASTFVIRKMPEEYFEALRGAMEVVAEVLAVCGVHRVSVVCEVE